MRKLFLCFLAVILIIFSFGCSKAEKATQPKELIKTQTAFSTMYSDPNSYKGYPVEFYAKIIDEPEKSKEGTFFQCFAFNNNNYNTIVGIESNIDLHEDDIVLIKGNVQKAFEGENVLGEKKIAPTIVATTIEKADYATAFSPAIKTKEINKEINQHGYLIKLNKVEFAEKETRVFLTITNNTKDKIHFWRFDSKATQGTTQIGEASNYEADYKKPECEILPGIIEEGIILFEKADPNQPLKLYFEGGSENYSLHLKTFTFDVE